MKNFKRIISFMMAMIIFASFFCYNTGAVNQRYEFVGPSMLKTFSSTSAHAYVRITDWAEEENTTDLYATTFAFLEDYDYLDGFYDVVAYVNLTVWLSDDSEASTYGTADPNSSEVEFEAYVLGSDCLNDYDHYSIVDFETSHKVEITFYVLDTYDSIVDYYTENDGPVIEISTID